MAAAHFQRQLILVVGQRGVVDDLCPLGPVDPQGRDVRRIEARPGVAEERGAPVEPRRQRRRARVRREVRGQQQREEVVEVVETLLEEVGKRVVGAQCIAPPVEIGGNG